MPYADPSEEERLLAAQLAGAGFSQAPAPGPIMSQAPIGPPPPTMTQAPPPGPPAAPPPPGTPPPSFRDVWRQAGGQMTSSPVTGIGTAAARVFDPAYGRVTGAPAKPAPSPELVAAGLVGANGEPPKGSPGAVFYDSPQTSQAMAPQIIPAHTVSLIDPARAKERDAAIQGEIQAAGVRGDADVEVKRAEGMAAKEEEGLNRAQAADVKAEAKVRRDEGMKYIENLQRLNQSVGDLTEDPDRYFKQRGTGQTILDMLGAALSGFVAGVKGGPNHYLEMMQHRIDQDILAQRHAIENKRTSLADAKGIYAEAYRITGDYDKAGELSRGYLAQALKGKVAQWTAGAQSLQAQAGRDAVVAHLEHQGVREKIADERRVPAGLAGGGGIPAKKADDIFVGADGQKYIARNGESRKKLTEATTIYKELQGALADYTSALKQVGATDKFGNKIGWSTQTMSRAQSAYNRALAIERKAQHDGIWKASEQTLLETTLTPPGNFSGDAEGQARLADKAAARAYMDTMRAEDPVPVQTAPNAPGLAPRAAYTGEEYARQKPEGGAAPVPKRPIE